MLPKVATHILHHTSRAVTAVQNQTGYTIRNVLQLQTQSSTPATTGGGLGSWNGAGSSSWGSGGAGPGGAKYNAGSRFYSGYTVSTTLSSNLVCIESFFRAQVVLLPKPTQVRLTMALTPSRTITMSLL